MRDVPRELGCGFGGAWDFRTIFLSACRWGEIGLKFLYHCK
jgi:hypothetical protein